MAAVPQEEVPPMTIAEAIGKARWWRQQPEVGVDDRQAKRVIDTLLAALEFSPPFLAAVQIGEPVFVLRGQDVLAPQLVRQWARLADSCNCPAQKVAEAQSKALRMEQWLPRKHPD